jgi:hypothetical protein
LRGVALGEKLFPMSHDGNNVGGDAPPKAPAPASYANAIKSNKSSPSFTPPPSKHLKKCELIYRDSTLPNGMNLHVTSISPDTLVFSIPTKVASENNVRDTLIDTYPGHAAVIEHAILYNVQYEVAPKDPMQKTEMLQNGLAINDKSYKAIVPTPAAFDIWKANFRYMPVHYRVDDILKLFNVYGRPLEIGAYHFLNNSDGCKYPTQEGYVLFEKDDSLSHPPLPAQIVVGRGLPISTKIVGSTPASKPRTKLAPKNKDTSSTPPAKDVQQQPDDGFKKVINKRTAKKRRKTQKAQEARDMEGVVDTSPALRHAQDNPQPQHVNNPPNSRSYLGNILGAAVNTITNYRQPRQSETSSESDSETETPDTPPLASTPQFLERSQRKRHDGGYNVGDLSRRSLQPSQH